MGRGKTISSNPGLTSSGLSAHLHLSYSSERYRESDLPCTFFVRIKGLKICKALGIAPQKWLVHCKPLLFLLC